MDPLTDVVNAIALMALGAVAMMVLTVWYINVALGERPPKPPE